MQRISMKLDFKSKIAEIEKKQPSQDFMSKQYDGIKVTVDNLMSEDQSPEREHEFPNKKAKVGKEVTDSMERGK